MLYTHITIICTHLIISVHIRCTSVIFIHACDKSNTSTAPLQEPFAAMQWIFVRMPLLPVWASLPTHKPVQQVIETLKTLQRKSGTAFSRATSITSLGSRLCFGPLFQLSVQRFAFLNVWIIVNPRAALSKKKKCTCETAMTCTTAMCYQQMTLTFEPVYLYTGIWDLKGVGSQAQVPPGAQRDAILLP